MDASRKTTISTAVDGKISNWLTVLPTAHEQFDLSAVKFCDNLPLCFMSAYLRMPSLCDGCGHNFDLTYALDCRKDG